MGFPFGHKQLIKPRPNNPFTHPSYSLGRWLGDTDVHKTVLNGSSFQAVHINAVAARRNTAHELAVIF